MQRIIMSWSCVFLFASFFSVFFSTFFPIPTNDLVEVDYTEFLVVDKNELT